MTLEKQICIRKSLNKEEHKKVKTLHMKDDEYLEINKKKKPYLKN